MPNRAVRRREGKIRAKTVPSVRGTNTATLDNSYSSSDFPPILAPTAVNMQETGKGQVTVQFVQSNVVFCQTLRVGEWDSFIEDLGVVLDGARGRGPGLGGLSVPASEESSLPSGLVIADRIPNAPTPT